MIVYLSEVLLASADFIVGAVPSLPWWARGLAALLDACCWWAL